MASEPDPGRLARCVGRLHSELEGLSRPLADAQGFR